MNHPLKYHGGKSYLAPKIIKLMPSHIHYVEPYAGGLAVLLAKNPEGTSEVINDIYENLTNFWKVLQSDSFDTFYRKVQAIPFSRTEWNNAKECTSLDKVDKAVAFFVYCRQSLSGRMKDFATLTKNRIRRGMNEQASAWLSSVEGLPEAHYRLKRVVIENLPAVKVIVKEDSFNTLFYLDPPYLHETRVSIGEYEHEMTLEDHKELLDLIQTCKGKVMISGYPSELYNTKLKNWNKHTFDLPNNASQKKEKERKEETVWCNY